MPYQKITYRGIECRSYLYFSFCSEEFDPDIITKELEIEPTSIKLKKEPTPKFTSWKYQINVGSEINLEASLEKLIDLFEPKVNIINQLKRKLKVETRLQFVIDIDINPEASTPYFPLNNRVIEFLNNTITDVDFDLYKIDTLGLLEK